MNRGHMRGLGGEKGEIKKDILLRMFKYTFEHKALLSLAIIIMIASNLLALWGPDLSGKAINAIGDSPDAVDMKTVIYYSALMLGAFALSAVLSYINSIVMVNLSQKITYTMRRQIFERLMVLPVGYFDKTATGNIISHISYDVDTVNASLSNDILQIGAGAITVVGSLIMMLRISPVMVSVFLFTIPASIIFTR